MEVFSPCSNVDDVARLKFYLMILQKWDLPFFFCITWCNFQSGLNHPHWPHRWDLQPGLKRFSLWWLYSWSFNIMSFPYDARSQSCLKEDSPTNHRNKPVKLRKNSPRVRFFKNLVATQQCAGHFQQLCWKRLQDKFWVAAVFIDNTYLCF